MDSSFLRIFHTLYYTVFAVQEDLSGESVIERGSILLVNNKSNKTVTEKMVYFAGFHQFSFNNYH